LATDDGHRCASCGGRLLIDEEARAPLFDKIGIAPALVAEIAMTGRDGPDCPRCGGTMKTFSLKGVEVDRCTGCGALWLDDFEQEQIEATAASTIPAAQLTPAQIEARAAQRAAERRNPSYGGQVAFGLDGQPGGWSPTSAQLVVFSLGGVLLILAGLSVFLTGEVPDTGHGPLQTLQRDRTVTGGSAYLLGALLLGGGVPMIVIPWLKRAQAKADGAWEDVSDRLD
jgi:Zn-finger nucleic acid-binding protein